MRASGDVRSADGREVNDHPKRGRSRSADRREAAPELPGLKKAEIDVEVTGEIVTISGTKEKEEKVERKDYYGYERTPGEFRCSVTLPVEVESTKATAQLKDGVLVVRVPKKEGAQPKVKKVTVA